MFRLICKSNAPRTAPWFILLVLATAISTRLEAYAVLTHEALIDAAWDRAIKQAILNRYPASTPEQLRQAHAYCYGGAIIQDIGYYPFGSHLFSDLTHYVRSGDFVISLIAQAQNLDEFAFALGALSHYYADVEGHSISINRTVPELYPKLRKKHGDIVTYQEGPTAHVRTEFGFDVLQIARGFYAPKAYHDFIGFQVARPLLDRAFEETYGLQLKDVFASVDLALGTYRWSVSKLLPEVTKAAWAAKKDTILRKAPAMNRKRFLYNLSRSSYEREWGRAYERPGWFARFLAALFRLLPKIGPLKVFSFRVPPADAELLFEKSFDTTLSRDQASVAAVAGASITLPNRNLDTGKPSAEGDYALADTTYSSLFRKLTDLRRAAPRALEADYLRFRRSR